MGPPFPLHKAAIEALLGVHDREVGLHGMEEGWSLTLQIDTLDLKQ